MSSQFLDTALVKTGGRLIKHARYLWLLLAEGHLTRWAFGTGDRCAGIAGRICVAAGK